jgi:hypothetical protein
MIFNIDLDRGVQSRTDPGTNVEVYMYWDTPGVYLNAHGTEVDVALAERAGFPVEEHLKKRRYQEAVKAAQDKAIAEIADADRSEKVVTKEKGGFTIVDIGYDRYFVFSPDGDKLTPTPLNLRSAVILLDQLVPDPQPQEKPTPKV